MWRSQFASFAGNLALALPTAFALSEIFYRMRGRTVADEQKAIELLDRLRGEDRAVADEKLRAVRATAKIAALQGWLKAVRLAAEVRTP